MGAGRNMNGKEEAKDMITLRPLAVSDIDFLVKLVTDQRVTQYLPGMITDRRMLGSWISGLGTNDHEYIILLGESEIGECSLNAYGDAAEAGIMLMPEQRNRGYGTEALEKLLASSVPPGIRTITATTAAENTAVIKLLDKSGFKQQDSGWMMKLSEDGEVLSEGQDILQFTKVLA